MKTPGTPGPVLADVTCVSPGSVTFANVIVAGVSPVVGSTGTTVTDEPPGVFDASSLSRTQGPPLAARSSLPSAFRSAIATSASLALA